MAALAIASTLAWGFIELAEAVSDGDARLYDRYILDTLFGSPDARRGVLDSALVNEIMRDITALGEIAVLSFIVLAVAGFLWLSGQRRATVFLLISVLTGLLISQGFKSLFDRQRPDWIAHGSYVDTASFPSGHSLMAALVYLTLAVMLARGLGRRSVKLYVTALAVLLVVAIGVSRVWLGVHWPSDVLAGWMVGTAWALCCGITASWLGRRGIIEPDQEDDPSG